MPPGDPLRTCVVVMGPSGAGKSTAARALAERLGWPMADADALHSPENVAKMAAGVPLDDADRAPWLLAVRDWIGENAAAGRDGVVACSALKRRYRDVLRRAEARLRFVELALPAAALEARLAERVGHYMPAALLASQLAALEPLAADEDGVRIVGAQAVGTLVDEALAALGLDSPPDRRRPSA